MNILIADDERNVRLTLISMLQDLNLEYKKILEADNGEKLIHILKELKPDIAFVDIKMPKLNGLEAIKYAKEISPNTKWVILTGFSEFDFAQKAIDLGVSKYLLKPVSPQTLEETITALIKDKSATYNDLNKKFERDIMALYNNFDIAKETKLEKIITSAKFEVAVIFFDGKTNNEGFSIHKKNFYHDVKNLISRVVSADVQITFFNISDFEVATVCAYEEENESSNYKLIVNSYFRQIFELAENLPDNNFSITVLNSPAAHSFTDINNNIKQIRDLGPLRVVMGTRCNHLASKIINVSNLNTYIDISRIVLDICRYFNEKKYLYFNYTLTQFEKTLSQNCKIINQTMKKNILYFLHRTISIKFQDSDNIANWIKELKKHGEKVLQEFDQNSSGYIDQVINFIKENYMNDIGLNTIADNLGITPNYLGCLFQKKTGMKFLDFLTEIRMLKAKELLAETDFSIGKISEMVGYQSARYFTKLFLKFEKQYPSDYRRSVR